MYIDENLFENLIVYLFKKINNILISEESKSNEVSRKIIKKKRI